MTLGRDIKPGGAFPPAHGLYSPESERDSCGVGFVAHVKGRPSHQIIRDAEHLLCRMDHRGALTDRLSVALRLAVRFDSSVDVMCLLPGRAALLR